MNNFLLKVNLVNINVGYSILQDALYCGSIFISTVQQAFRYSTIGKTDAFSLKELPVKLYMKFT